ncbi:MAG: hypothetical protein QXK74_02305 [Candidatus Nitrosocaldaceae archaeon]
MKRDSFDKINLTRYHEMNRNTVFDLLVNYDSIAITVYKTVDYG